MTTKPSSINPLPVSFDVHLIASVELGEVVEFAATPDCEAFAVRHLTITRDDGVRIKLGLFADEAAALRMLPHKRPQEVAHG